MRFLKLALISAVGLFIVIWLISLLLPSHVRVSRAVDIHATEEKIHPLLADMREWEKWNDYIRAYHNKVTEPDMMKADETSIFITEVKTDLVTAEWHSASGDKFGSGFAIIKTRQQPSVTTVQWYFDFHLKWYPWQKFQSIIYDQQLGPVMEKSLANLKKMTENPGR